MCFGTGGDIAVPTQDAGIRITLCDLGCNQFGPDAVVAEAMSETLRAHSGRLATRAAVMADEALRGCVICDTDIAATAAQAVSTAEAAQVGGCAAAIDEQHCLLA